MDVHQSLERFISNYLKNTPPEQRLTEYDPQWPSLCVNANNAAYGELVEWQPQQQVPQQTFENMESALGVSIHPDVKAFYTGFWSDNLAAVAPRGQCELLQPWNEDDFARLQENLIGHVLMKQRLKQSITLFIGLTDEDDFILSLDNQTGQVMLEQVGKEPQEVIAQCLSEFIDSLKTA